MRTIVKVEIQTYQITYMSGVLYMEPGSIAIRMGILEMQKRNSKAMSTGMGNTGMWSLTGTRGENYTIDGNNRVST